MNELAPLVPVLITGLLGLIVWILTGIRDDLRGLTKRVGEHDAFIAAFKTRQIIGG